MKTLLSILSCTFLSLTSFAQQSIETKMLEDAVRSLNESGTIIYGDSSMNFYGLVSKASKQGKLEGYFDTTKVSLHLTKSEINFLDKEFKKHSTFAWAPSMFDNSIITSYDSVNFYRLKLMKEQKGRKDKRYFHFSRIVYFRNNSIAVFRLAEMYGYSAGYDYLFFYQKNENEWKRIMKVYMGAW